MNKRYDKRYEDNPVKYQGNTLPGLEPEIVPKFYPHEFYDVMTYHKIEFFRNRNNNGIKAAWLYDRLTGSRLKGGHNRNLPEGKSEEFYYRHELLDNFEYFLENECNDKCACCGIEMNYGLGYNKSKKSHLPRPSIDRINNDEGYTCSNSRIICLPCNITKGDS